MVYWEFQHLAVRNTFIFISASIIHNRNEIPSLIIRGGGVDFDFDSDVLPVLVSPPVHSAQYPSVSAYATHA